jgi:hypothetical protein
MPKLPIGQGTRLYNSFGCVKEEKGDGVDAMHMLFDYVVP